MWSVAKGTDQVNESGYFISYRDDESGGLCLAPIGRLTCMTTRSSRSFYSALRSMAEKERKRKLH
jgi:hypothetical protein